MPDPIRPARPGTLRRFLILHLILVIVINLILFNYDLLRPLASATGGLLTGSLVANLTLLGVLGVGTALRFGGLRPYDVGLIVQRLPAGVGFTLGVWAAAQGVHLLAGWIANGQVTVSVVWTSYPQVLIGVLLVQFFGNALFEEIGYRGFLFPQLYLRFERVWVNHSLLRLIAALVVSQMLFALAHIPNRLYLGLDAEAILHDQIVLFIFGVLFAVIYAHTDNLFLVTGVHALGNAPAVLFDTAPILSGSGASILVYALALFGLFGLPVVWRHRRRLGGWMLRRRALSTPPLDSNDEDDAYEKME